MQRKTSVLKRVVQAAVLAVVLLPMGSVSLEAVPWYFFCSNEFGGCGAEDESTSYTWGFGDYYLSLQFDMPSGGYIGVDVTAAVIDDETFQSKADQFPGYECLGVTQSGDCVEFTVDPFLGSSGSDWDHYTIEIGWNKIEGQILEAARMTLLHDRSTLPNNGTTDYDYDTCLGGLYDYDSNPSTPACDIDPDPRIRSGDTDFRTWVAAYRPAEPVPEPSTLLLLGAGAGVAGLRKRRHS
jgi:hypothetical protein